jgi:hypothetical protein
LIRPVRKVEETITVSFSIALLQLISVVEKEQVLKTNVWLQVVCRKNKRKNVIWIFLLFFRNGMIIKCNGNEKNMVVFNQYVFRRAKFGHPM